ncbi:thioredoxin domain-containing protein [Corynebacterium kalidii]
MSQKIKAPNDKNRSFLWGIVALVVICVVFIGFMVFNGRNANSDELKSADVSFSVSQKDGIVSLRAQEAAENVPNVEVFEDYSCHYCAELTKVDSESMQKAVEDGEMNVDIRTVNFLDNGNNPSSTRAGVVALAIADTGDAGAFWAFHEKAFGDQSTVARDWDYEDFANAAEQLGIDSEVVDSIRDESVVDKYQSQLELNTEELNTRMDGRAATPALYVDGESLQIGRDPENPEKMKDWVPDVIGRDEADAPKESGAATETESSDAE